MMFKIQESTIKNSILMITNPNNIWWCRYFYPTYIEVVVDFDNQMSKDGEMTGTQLTKYPWKMAHTIYKKYNW